MSLTTETIQEEQVLKVKRMLHELTGEFVTIEMTVSCKKETFQKLDLKEFDASIKLMGLSYYYDEESEDIILTYRGC